MRFPVPNFWSPKLLPQLQRAFELSCPAITFVVYIAGRVSCLSFARETPYTHLLDTVALLQRALITFTVALLIQRRKLPRDVLLPGKRKERLRKGRAFSGYLEDGSYTIAHALSLLVLQTVSAFAMYVDLKFDTNDIFFTEYIFCLDPTTDFTNVILDVFRYFDWALFFFCTSIRLSQVMFYSKMCEAFQANMKAFQRRDRFIFNPRSHLRELIVDFIAMESHLCDLQTMISSSILFSIAVQLRQFWVIIEEPSTDVVYFSATVLTDLVLIFFVAHSNSMVSIKFISIRNRLTRREIVSRKFFKSTVRQSLAFRDWTGESLTRNRVCVALQAIVTMSVVIHDMTREGAPPQGSDATSGSSQTK